MSLRSARKVIFDTSVYIDAIQGGPGNAASRLLIDCVPATYLCSVVAAELYAGVLDTVGARLVRQFVARCERVGRRVTPSHASWGEAGRILANIGNKEPAYRSKLRGLFNDVLIALSAWQIGATVYTKDGKDFRLIHRHKRFRMEVWQER